MIGMGLALFAGGCGIFALGVFAEMNHPLGGDDTTEGALRDGAIVAGVGLLCVVVGWLL